MGGVIIKNSFNDFFEYVNDINDSNEQKSKRPNKKVILGINLLAIILLVSGGYGVKYILDQQHDIKEAEERRQELLLSQQKQANVLQEKLKKQQVEDEKTNPYRDFNKLKAINPDTVAWLKVPDTDIDMPIVKTNDNVYYLTHDFDKKYNSMGWAFADSKNSFPELSTNTIMYGHTYKSTTIFSNLKNVLDAKWLEDDNKHIITLDTEKERLIFKVFSIYTIDETNDYLYISFANNNKYQNYLNKSLKRSIKDFKVKVTTKDKILTLSTCYITEHQRLVVQAKLIGSE